MTSIEKQFALKIAQLQEEVKSNPPAQKATDFKEIVRNTSDELTKKVEETLTSGSIYNWLIGKIEGFIEPEVKEFTKNNQHKMMEYASNTDSLVEDITAQVEVFKYLKYLNYAMDAAFVVTSIGALVTTIFTAGAGAGVAIPAELAKWGARTQLQRFIKKFGKQMITKAFVKKVLKYAATKGVAGISKHFLLAGVRQAGLIITLDVFSTVAQEASLIALKNTIIKEGSSTFGIPKPLVGKLVKAKDNKTFVQVLEVAKNKIAQDLKELFSTEAGFRNLAMSAALGKLFKMRGIKSTVLKTNARTAISLALKDSSNYDINTLKDSLKKKLKRKRGQDTPSALSNHELLEILRRSQVPEMLHNEYVEFIQEEIDDIDSKEKAKEQAQKTIQKKEILLDTVRDSIKDISTLEVMRENKRNIDPREMKLLFKDVVGHDFSAQQLMSDYDASSFEDLLNKIKNQKEKIIDNLIERIAIGKTGGEFIRSLRSFLEEQLELEAHDINLMDDLEKGEDVPLAASLNNKLNLFSLKVAKS